MVINRLLQKASDALGGLVKHYQDDELKYNEYVPPGSQRINTACETDCPVDTAIVVDVSGSMDEDDYHPTRLDGGIKASVEYVNARAGTHPKDRIAVVLFSDNGRVVLGLTDISKIDRITAAIKSLRIGGGTNITTGLQKAVELFRKDSVPGRLRRIILLTDGRGGHPVRTADKLKQQYNTLIDVIGIGGSRKAVNERLLQRVATTDPDGFNHYYFIRNSKTLREHYRKLATGLVWNGK